MDDETERLRQEIDPKRCMEHCSVCEVIHSLRGRLGILEQRVALLERKLEYNRNNRNS